MYIGWRQGDDKAYPKNKYQPFINVMQFCFPERTFQEKFQTFHQNLTKHYLSGGPRLYNLVEMEKFSNEHAPGLFDALLATISDGKDVSKKRKETQKKRTVAVLHQLSYFRNQVRKNIDIYHVYLNKHSSTVTFWCGTFLTELKCFDKLSRSCRVQYFLVY